MNSYERIQGNIKRVIFHNEDNHFYVLLVNTDDDQIVVAGNLPNFKNEETKYGYEFSGQFVEHAKYGLQFKALEANLVMPSQTENIIDFLSNSNFKGIGKKTAQNIYELYNSENVLGDILLNPEPLLTLKGIDENKVAMITAQITKYQQDDNLFNFINEHNLNYNQLMKLYNKASIEINDFITILNDNPYLLMKHNVSYNDINKIVDSFELADRDLYQFAGYLYQKLKDLTFRSGSTYLERHILLDEQEDIDMIDEALSYLADVLLIIIEGDKIFEYEQYQAEVFIAEFFDEFAKENSNEDIANLLDQYESYHGIRFNTLQKEALDKAVNNSISIITGGPGTGKSTIVDALIYILKGNNPYVNIALCAPTGKASKRLSDLTSLEATTIHKMLKYDMRKNNFAHNIFNPLEYDVLIIDEASMIDNLLMAHVLKASFHIKQIIFLGDVNQLPSVSQGQVLSDLINSQHIDVTFLQEIYRQKEGSYIIDLAYRILNNEQIVEADINNEEIRLISLDNRKQINALLAEYAGYELYEQCQIIAPLYGGVLGIDKINRTVQSLKHEDQLTFHEKDYVIQLKNRNDEKVYNGDTGYIVSVNPKQMVIDFNDKTITYDKTMQHELALAYAISIHKAQGNEYNKVIIILQKQSSHFLDKKMLYTAITRAKKELVIISNLDIINHSIHRKIDNQRHTMLKERLNKVLSK